MPRTSCPQQRQGTPGFINQGVDAQMQKISADFLQEGYTQKVTGKLILKLSADHHFNKACGEKSKCCGE